MYPKFLSQLTKIYKPMSHLRPPALWKAGQILFNKRAGFLLIVMGQGIALHLEIDDNIINLNYDLVWNC